MAWGNFVLTSVDAASAMLSVEDLSVVMEDFVQARIGSCGGVKDGGFNVVPTKQQSTCGGKRVFAGCLRMSPTCLLLLMVWLFSRTRVAVAMNCLG